TESSSKTAGSVPCDRPAGRPELQNPRGMSVVVVERASELAEYVSRWEELAAQAIEPNAFYEPWMLLPAVEFLGKGQDLLFVLVFAPDQKRPEGPPRLCGFFPLQRRRWKRLPISFLSLWKHNYCFLCTPLISA